MKKFLSAILILGILCSFAACGSGDTPTVQSENTVKQSATGRYELQEIQWANGTTASGDVLQSAEDSMGDMYLELYSDNTAQLSLYGQINDMVFSSDKIWKENQALISYEFSVANGKAILKNDDGTYIFVKK